MAALEHVDRRADVDPSTTYRLLGVRWYGNGCHLHDVIDGSKLKTKVLNGIRANDVTYNKMWVTKGAFAVASIEHDGFWATSEYPTFEVREEAAAPTFLRYLMRTPDFASAASAKTLGSTSRARLNPSDFLSLEVNLPPLDEQRQIAAILEGADDAVAAAQLVMRQTEKVKRGVASQLLTRGMPGRHTRFRLTEIGEIPESWDVVPLADAAEVHNSGRTPISADERAKMKGPFPYYGPTRALDSIATYRYEGEYVLIGEDGDHFLKFDRWNMTQRVSGKFSVNNHAHVLRGTRAANAWLDWFFRHRDITSLITRQGANRYKLRKATLLELPVAIPSSSEQREICRVLDTIDAASSEQSTGLHATQRTRNGLAADLVSGRVRVTP